MKKKNEHIWNSVLEELRAAIVITVKLYHAVDEYRKGMGKESSGIGFHWFSQSYSKRTYADFCPLDALDERKSKTAISFRNYTIAL